MSLHIIPITLKQASKFVNEFHRHHSAPVGCKFAIGVENGNKLVGVAICGRPVGKSFDNGITLEINRVCTDGTKNACSKLYGACCRIAREMGYKRIITYTLQSENGASLKASNFIYDGIAGGVRWTGARYVQQQLTISQDFIKQPPLELKRRWIKDL